MLKTWLTKVNLLGGLRIIPPPLTTALLSLNSIRNEFSHNPYFQMSRRRLRKFIESLPYSQDKIREDISEREVFALGQAVYVCFCAVAHRLNGYRDHKALEKALRLWMEEQNSKFGKPPESQFGKKFKNTVDAERARHESGEI
jgi:hypothetical protein